MAKVKSQELKEEVTVNEVLEREDKAAFEAKKASATDDVTVEVYNIEEAGYPIPVAYIKKGFSYKKKLFHGGTYTMPREVAKFIEDRKTPIYTWRPNGTGVMEKTIIGYRQRFSCKQAF